MTAFCILKALAAEKSNKLHRTNPESEQTAFDLAVSACRLFILLLLFFHCYYSPVEEHFYRRQHIDVSRSMAASLRRYPPTTQLSSLDRSSLAALLGPLLRLRQGCCHPQAVRGQFLSIQKNTLTMEELLDQLIKKAVNETEEAHRHYIAALNGLAGEDTTRGLLSLLLRPSCLQ